MKKILLLLPLFIFFACSPDEEVPEAVNPLLGSWERINPAGALYGYVFTDKEIHQWWLSPTGYEIEKSGVYINLYGNKVDINWGNKTESFQFELVEIEGEIKLILDGATFDKTIDLRPILGIK